MTYLIITRPGCGYCDKAKTLLQERNLHYQEDVRDTPELVAAFKADGYKTFPQIWENGQHIGGYDDLRNYFDDF